MNGVPVSGLWQEARNQDGRVYYYNTQTKATQWHKPEELMTGAEVSRTSSQCMSRLTQAAACARESTMEGVHRRRRTEVLVQHRNETKLMGDAGSLQECVVSEPTSP